MKKQNTTGLRELIFSFPILLWDKTTSTSHCRTNAMLYEPTQKLLACKRAAI
jgi:hypothetical protein